jgi:hypothetical protein
MDVPLMQRTPDDVMDLNIDPYESNTAYTWTNSGQLSLKRFYINFDFSQIPANATIQSAALSLYYNATDNAEGFDYHTGSNEAYIERVTAPWNKNTITWNNQATTTTVNRVSLAASTSQTQHYTDIDVTQLVLDMVNDPNGAHGFRVKMQNESSPYRSLLFASSRHPDSAIRPKLVIVYTLNSSNCFTHKPGPSDGMDVPLMQRTPDDVMDLNIDPYESNTAYTWTNSGQLSLKRFYLNFDFSQIPANATIQSAALSLYYNATDNAEGFDYHTGSNEAYIERVTAPWNKNTITWNNQATTTTVNRVSLAASTSQTQHYTNIDVTQLVQDMVNDPNGAHGFRVKMQNESSPYRSLLFASSRHTDSTMRPEINVCYSTITSVVDYSNQNTFTIYPNPTNNLLNINTTLQGNDEVQYQIINTLGATAMANKVTAKDFSIDVSTLPSGIYFIHLQSGNAKTVKRFVKE